MSSTPAARVYARSTGLPASKAAEGRPVDLKLVETRPADPKLPSTPDVAAEAQPVTLVFASTFRTRDDYSALMRHELHRLVTATRRLPGCLFCDLFRLSANEEIFVIQTAWVARKGWLPSAGWENHPAGGGLLDQCLLEPIVVTQMEEEDIPW